jgi:hypothetical protein
MKEYFDLIRKVVYEYVLDIITSIKSNQAARETLKSICDLLADVVEIVNIEIPRSYKDEEIIRLCTPSTLTMVVRPAVDQLLATYIVGAYPLCYQPIKISTEALAYSLYVDLSTPSSDNQIFFEKLLKFQEDLDSKQIRSLSKLIKDHLANIIGKELSDKMIKIWGKTSNDFLHFKGYLDKVSRWESNNLPSSDVPPSFLVGAFVEYGDADEPHLNELRNVVEEFRELIKETWRFWKNWYASARTSLL